MTSCFKLIVCAGDHKHDVSTAAGNDESTTLSDKRRWSFRRKSSSQRVILHTVGESSGSDIVDFIDQPIIAPQEETTVTNVEESAVTLIQTAVRTFLAQRELAKLKMLVKLQAAVRGHLVRQNALKSLHCIQSIVKMQALVHVRYGKPLGTEEKAQDSYHSASMISVPDKLLRNSFARQLMKSTRNPKHHNIEINPSSPSPLWSWMELWMSLVSPDTAGHVPETEHEQVANVMGARSLEKDHEISKHIKLSSIRRSGDMKTQKNIKLSRSPVTNSPRTPSSQLIDKSGYTKIKFRNSKDSSSSVRKSSPAVDFSGRGSEQLRRIVDSRPTLGDTSESDSGSVSLPSYMKATASAKARLFASTSPRLSHDEIAKEISLTKRHSLPVQSSPKLRQPSAVP